MTYSISEIKGLKVTCHKCSRDAVVTICSGYEPTIEKEFRNIDAYCRLHFDEFVNEQNAKVSTLR